MTYQPPPGPAGPPAQDPGRTLGIVGLLVAIFCGGIIGLVISIIAYNTSKKAGYKNNIALAGIIVGAVVLVGYIIGWIVYLSSGAMGR